MSKYYESITGLCIAEFMGTGLFIFFGTSVLSAAKVARASFGLWEICVVWGLGIALAVYLTAGISGAHLNPAVTISLWMFSSFDPQKVVPYIAVQMAGAFCGAALTYLIYHNMFAEYEHAHQMIRGRQDSLFLASIFSTYPAASISVWLAGLVEIIISSILLGLIMALTDDGNGVPKGPLAPLLIGMLVAVISAANGALDRFCHELSTRLWSQILHLPQWLGIGCDDGWQRDSLLPGTADCACYRRDPWGSDLSLWYRASFTRSQNRKRGKPYHHLTDNTLMNAIVLADAPVFWFLCPSH
ncbi:Propanediol diffusion facilitator [Sodalis glossinidius str. 'morsitans']|uniref:Propanediol diffusion facilitator n=1 Tax=Sodalis glossinidius (strain morsitans) TaxID=343509 RepID=Q2NRU2_SODGM|nr:propanediol diffusion facilitator [Sodalis glossinidius str. 'morsitans']CRL46075.1 Propanediol diffusion facilitator [Sodalis glossinidius str. 'morsitans']